MPSQRAFTVAVASMLSALAMPPAHTAYGQSGSQPEVLKTSDVVQPMRPLSETLPGATWEDRSTMISRASEEAGAIDGPTVKLIRKLLLEAGPEATTDQGASDDPRQRCFYWYRSILAHNCSNPEVCALLTEEVLNPQTREKALHAIGCAELFGDRVPQALQAAALKLSASADLDTAVDGFCISYRWGIRERGVLDSARRISDELARENDAAKGPDSKRPILESLHRKLNWRDSSESCPGVEIFLCPPLFEVFKIGSLAQRLQALELGLTLSTRERDYFNLAEAFLTSPEMRIDSQGKEGEFLPKIIETLRQRSGSKDDRQGEIWVNLYPDKSPVRHFIALCRVRSVNDSDKSSLEIVKERVQALSDSYQTKLQAGGTEFERAIAQMCKTYLEKGPYSNP